MNKTQNTAGETLKGVTAKGQKVFSNLEDAIRNESFKSLKEFKDGLTEKKSVNDLIGKWYYSELLTKGAKSKEWAIESLKEYLVERKVKQLEKRLEDKLSGLARISEAGEAIEITISIEWRKSRMWGSNPSATARVQTTKGYFTFESGSIGGCGYDKQSTAVAQVLNQCEALLNMMYKVKDSSSKVDNRDLFGYGSGYGILPSIEGGVGVSCYPQIMEKLGLTFKTVASGKMYDCYQITKK
jgi:hypothetical protein